jgi:hypothetical protein
MKNTELQNEFLAKLVVIGVASNEKIAELFPDFAPKEDFTGKFITLKNDPTLILFVTSHKCGMALGGWTPKGFGQTCSKEPTEASWSFRAKPSDWRTSTPEEVISLFSYLYI